MRSGVDLFTIVYNLIYSARKIIFSKIQSNIIYIINIININKVLL